MIARILLCLLFLPAPALADFSGRVVGISDGDTIKVLHNGNAEKIRLHGIDCPEKGQAFGTKAKQFTSEMVFGKDVTVQVKDTDRYWRTVGEVILPDGRSLNRELVAAGLAWWYKRYSHDKSLGQLEADARDARKGLWADPDPVPPWEWRRKKKEALPSGTNNPGRMLWLVENIKAKPSPLTKIRTDRDSFRLRGPVRTVITEVQEIALKDGQVIERPRAIQSIYTYDQRGNHIEHEIYLKPWAGELNVIAHETKAYNEHGDVVEKSSYLTESGRRRHDNKTRYVPTYNTKGQKIEEAEYYGSDGEISSKTIFVYDEKGRLAETISPPPPNSPWFGTSKAVYKYDDNSNIIEQSSSSLLGAGKLTAKYDHRNNIVEHALFDSTGSLEERMVWTYDTNGKTMCVETFTSNGKLSSQEFKKHDSYGNWLESEESGILLFWNLSPDQPPPAREWLRGTRTTYVTISYY